MKYRKKPVIIEAVKWTGENVKEIADFMGVESVPYDLNTHDLSIMTLEGVMVAKKGDYIIKGVQGEFYPCKPDIFVETYEELEYLNILDTI